MKAVLLTLVLVAAALAASELRLTHGADSATAPAPGSGCAVLADISGSTSDYPATRAWFASLLEDLLAAYDELRPLSEVTVIAYGDEARVLDTGGANGADTATPAHIVDTVVASMGSGEWTDPLAAFRQASSLDSLGCVLNLTDGTLDLPPSSADDPAGYTAELLAIADELGGRGIPVITLTLVDDSGDLWSGAAYRSGGMYIVDADVTTLLDALVDFVPKPEPTPTPTATPAPPPTPTPTVDPGEVLTPEASPSPTPPPGTAPHGALSPLWLATLPVAALGLLVVGAAAARARSHRLAGHLTLPGPDSDTDVDLSGFRRSVTLGTRGKVKVEGPGVQPRHARLSAEEHEGNRLSTVVRPADGPVSVIRGAEVLRVIFELALEDGDVLILGETRVRFQLLMPAYA